MALVHAQARNAAFHTGLSTMNTQASRTRGRWLFPALALVTIAMPLIGFAPTYYLKSWFGTPALQPLVHVHAAVFTLWCALLLMQVVLVRTGRRVLHRQLGYASVLLAAAMVVTGILIVLGRPRPSAPERAFILTPLVGMVLFAALYAAAIHFRRDGGMHKRLMILATLLVASAGLTRVSTWLGLDVRTPLMAGLGGFHHLYAYALVLIPMVAFDLLRLQRLHPATLWGGALLLLRHPLAALFAYSTMWQEFAAQVTCGGSAALLCN